MFLRSAGISLPEELRDLDTLTSFGVIYRYEDYVGEVSLDRQGAREMIRALRRWVEGRMAETADDE